MSKTINATGRGSPVENHSEPTRAKGRPTGRVAKRDWLDMALTILVSEGVDAVRVTDLARRLKISKSGFYWHFRDREELLQEMQHYWVDEFSREFFKDADAREGSLRGRLVSLVQAIRAKQSSKLDLAFVSWAQTDPNVRDLVNSVRDMRIAFVRDFLGQFGREDDDLTTRARLFVVYFGWSDVMFEPHANGLAGEDLNAVLDIIVGDCVG